MREWGRLCLPRYPSLGCARGFPRKQMKANYFVDKSKNCTTDDEAEILCNELEAAFLTTPEFAGFTAYNQSSHMKGDTPCLDFEMNHEISNAYMLTVRPGIRDSQLTIDIMLQFMKDGLGTNSTSFETRYEDIIEVAVYIDVSIEALADEARRIAIRFHTDLIEEVGIPAEAAREAAEKAWPVKSSPEA